MTFPTSVIRKLAPSEEYFAQTSTFSAVRVHVSGPVDVDAMSDAFDALLQAHPVLTGHLEAGPDGRHQIVTDDLLHPGIWVVEKDGPALETPAVQLDQSVSLANLRVQPGNGQADVALYLHHSLADGHHMAELLAELFSWYTDLVCTGSVGPVTAEPAPDPVEALLEERGIRKQRRSGLERFIPAMFAYELPPSRSTNCSNPAKPVVIPAARGQLTNRETMALVEFGWAHQLFLNSLVSAAILLAEWRLRETPHIPVPYLYPVNLRLLLEPPVAATGATNALGLAAYLAEIKPKTTIVDLARDISETFEADLSEGVIQQSQLHFDLRYSEGAPGLPDVVFATNLGRVPAMRTPPNVELDDWQTEHHRTSLTSDWYSVGIFAEQLLIEHHVHAAAPERSLDLVLSLLRAASFEYQR